MVTGLTAARAGLIVLLAFLPTLVIQTIKVVKERTGTSVESS